MTNSVLVWKTSIGTIYGAVAFDDNEYDCNTILRMVADEFDYHFSFMNGDILTFEEIDEDDKEDSEGYKYLTRLIEIKDTHKIVMVVGSNELELIYEEESESDE